MTRPNDLYTDKQREKYCELAISIGIYPAMRELGYPKSRMTASKWLEQRGLNQPDQILQPSDDEEVGTIYGKAQQLRVLGLVLARLEDLLTSDLLEADEMSKVAHAAEKTVSAIRLIQDKPTHISGQSLPPETQAMLDRLAGANEARLAAARAPQDLRKILELTADKAPAQLT